MYVLQKRSLEGMSASAVRGRRAPPWLPLFGGCPGSASHGPDAMSDGHDAGSRQSVKELLHRARTAENVRDRVKLFATTFFSPFSCGKNFGVFDDEWRVW